MAKQFATFAADKIRVTTNLPSGFLTVMAWVKWNSASAVYRPWFYRCNNSGPTYLFSGLTNTGVLQTQWVLFNSSLGQGNITGISPVVGTWYHLALAIADHTIAVYVNGIPSGIATDTGTSPAFNNDMLMLGHDDDADAETGLCSMCCVKVWDQAVLTGEEIQAEMFTARAQLRDKLYLEMPLDLGVDFTDYSPKGNLVTLTGTITDPDAPANVDFYWNPPISYNLYKSVKSILTTIYSGIVSFSIFKTWIRGSRNA